MKWHAGIFFCAVGSVFVFHPHAALAQAYPTKPIRVVVPFPPGGVDLPMRLIQARMAESLGQPIVIENRPGANGYIGSENVARSAPDGYSVLATSASTIVSGPLISKSVPFDPVKDFTPVTMLTRSVNVFVLNSLQIKSVKELIDLAKRSPGKLSYASSGVGSSQHLDGEAFKLAAGVNMVHVPYKGGGPEVQAILAGEIEVALVTYQQIHSYLASGKVRILATYDGKRFPGLAAVPDVIETLPNFQKSASWIGVLGPAGLPRPITMRLYEAITKAINAPDTRSKLDSDSLIVANTPDEFVEAMRIDIEQTSRIVKSLGIKFEE